MSLCLAYGQKFNFASQRHKSETTLKEIATHFLNKIGDSNYLITSCLQDMNTFTIFKNVYVHIKLYKIHLELCWKYSSLFLERILIDLQLIKSRFSLIVVAVSVDRMNDSRTCGL